MGQKRDRRRSFPDSGAGALGKGCAPGGGDAERGRDTGTSEGVVSSPATRGRSRERLALDAGEPRRQLPAGPVSGCGPQGGLLALGPGSGWSRLIVEQQLGESRGPRVRLAGNAPRAAGTCPGSHRPPQRLPQLWEDRSAGSKCPQEAGGGQPAARTLRAWGHLRAQPLSRVRLCHPMDTPGSPVHVVLQARHWGGRLQTDCGLWLVSELRGRGLGSWGPSSSPHLLQIHPRALDNAASVTEVISARPGVSREARDDGKERAE